MLPEWLRSEKCALFLHSKEGPSLEIHSSDRSPFRSATFQSAIIIRLRGTGTAPQSTLEK
jgi:hypothetical protein